MYCYESTKSTQDALGFIQPLILIFAVIALFVGSFIIANTFSMIVRESMRGYALLRSIGASPLQSVLHGDRASSVAGPGRFARRHRGRLGHGQLIASGWANMGMPLTGATNPTVSDMLVGLVVGIVVTLIGAALPANGGACPADSGDERNRQSGKARPRTCILGTVMVLLGFLSSGFHLRFGRRGW